MTECKQKTVHMLNWSVWNRAVFRFNCVNKRLYLWKTELFEINWWLCAKKTQKEQAQAC